MGKVFQGDIEEMGGVVRLAEALVMLSDPAFKSILDAIPREKTVSYASWSEKKREQWKNPEYRAKMVHAAKNRKTQTLARREGK